MNKLLLILVLIVWAFVFGSYYQAGAISYIFPKTPVIPTITPFKGLNSEKLWDIIQEWRTSQNLSRYIHSENMCRIARLRIEEVKNDWSHKKFTANRFCSNDCIISENLAKDFYSEKDTLTAWINSPSHLHELKKPYTHACIITDGSYSVQIFGYF